MKNLITLLLIVSSIGFSQNFWEQTNGPCKASIFHFAINSNNHIIAGGPGESQQLRGVFYSSDNGNYWIQKGLADVSMSALTVNSNDHIFVGTNTGIFRSTDNGDNWVGLSLTSKINSLTTNPSDQIFAGTEFDVLRSTDNGESWTEINNGLPQDFKVICLKISSTGDIFLSGEELVIIYPPLWYPREFRSTDNGEDWVSIDFSFYPVNTFAFNSSGHIFAGSSDGIFRSVNNGDTWSGITNGLTNYSINSVAINSIDYIFAGTEAGVFYSTNNGDLWVDINHGWPINSIKSLVINADDDIFAGSRKGIIFTSDNGANWSGKNKGLVYSDIRSLLINSDGNIFCGSWGDGIFYSANNGGYWLEINSGLGDFIISSLAANSSGHIFAGGLFGVFSSTNNGQDWINKGLNSHFIFSLAINSSEHIFATAFQSVFRSTDNGDNWIDVSNGFTNVDVSASAINSNGHIFAGTGGEGVFRSTDNGDNWIEINNGLTYLNVNSLAINSSGDIFAGTFNNVFRSTNNGNDWIQTNLTALNISSIEIDPTGNIFVSSNSDGVFRSTDNGESWLEINSGLTYKNVYSLVASDEYIFAGVADKGVFIRLNSTTSVGDQKNILPTSFSLSQNYPNPFNPSTKISYSIPKVYFVSLKVYDLLGKEIVTLVNEEKQIGKYEIEFDGSNLSSGIYFYRMQAGNFVDTKKFILIK